VLAQLFLSFAKIGAFSFGGGYAMIPLISKEVVESKAWLSMPEFIDVIALSQATPGPIAINAATYVGYKIGGFWGSVVATTGVVFPSFVIMMVLGYLFFRYRDIGFVKDIFRGVRPAAVALVLAAALSIVSSSVTGTLPAIVAAAVILGILALDIDPVVLLLASGIMGYFIYR
jgi:chromate transporter